MPIGSWNRCEPQRHPEDLAVAWHLILKIEKYQFLNLVVFYAEPKDLNQIPKRIADKESIEAAYFSMEEIVALKSKWRGP